jgi:hypothetical protein
MSPHTKAVLASVVVAVLALVPVAGLYNSMNSDRAALTISAIGFEPFPLVANERVLIVISFKNTGKNYATIDAVATDRVKNKLPDNPIYEPARIPRTSIAGGEELQIISDLGDQPLILTQSQINSLSAPATPLKFIGFIKYTDQKHPWILGGGVVRFCYLWDPKVTSADNFSACNEGQYTERYDYWLFDNRLKIREVPMITVGTQTLTPITASPKFPDPKYPIKKLEIRPKK